MSLILSGTDGLSDVDGSAATPAIRGTDSNTGIFFPAADTIAFAEGGVESARLDSSGNLGLGVTPSAWWSSSKAMQIGAGTIVQGRTGSADFAEIGANVFLNSSAAATYIATAAASRYQQSGGGHFWYTAPSGTAGNAISFSQAMTLTAGGSLGVGTTSPAQSWTGASARVAQLQGGSAQITVLRINESSATSGDLQLVSSTISEVGIYNFANGAMRFGTNGAERARIDSSGNLLVGVTSNPYHVLLKNLSGDWVTRIQNTASSSPFGLYLLYSSAAPNNTSSEFLYCADSGAIRATIQSNGGIANFSGNNVNLSDRREKTNFAPAKSYLETICAIPVQTFNYIDQNMEDDPGLTLGVVAQDVQEVAPELVMESNWGTKEEPKQRLSIYQTDLQYALMKCIQEQQVLIQEIKAELAALKGAA
jgi:hypothetical protein